MALNCSADKPETKRLRDDAPEEWGSAWTWLALDSESKLIISYHIGQRDADSAAGVTFSDFDAWGNPIRASFRPCDIEMALFSKQEV